MLDMAALARAYDAAPTFDEDAVPAWRALAAECGTLARYIRTRLRVVETDAREPYARALNMFVDIAAGRFVVSRANSAHPLWTVEQNVAFRIVHDVCGHYPSGGGFDWAGEVLACAAHAALLSPLAQRALHTECLAQTASAIRTGRFGPQKAVLL